MRIFSSFLLIGTIFIQFLETVPSFLFLFFLALIFVVSLILLAKTKLFLSRKFLITISAVFLGLSLSSVIANYQLQNRLLPELEGKDIVLQGVIKDIPDNRKDSIRFKLKIYNAFLPENKNISIPVIGTVRLGWFHDIQTIHAGELWQLRVRLKRPSGFMNPGGFDYEKWLFTQRVVATGYVRKGEETKKIQAAPWWSINHLREEINLKIQNTVSDKKSAAVLSALSVAIRTHLDDSQWQLLQKTGTSHLIAISGLHIAVVAGFAFFPIFLIWRLFPHLNEKIPVQLAGGTAGVVFATIYALLAGFTLPTQRALLMVIVILIGLISHKNQKSSTTLAIALIAVLLFDPLAAMSISFWLSFSAVGLILIILKRQLVKPRFNVLRLQLFLSFGMLPLTLIFFGSGSLVAPLANLIAIPWVSILVVPITLLAVIFLPFSEFVSSSLLNLSGMSIHYLFQILNILNELPISTMKAGGVPFNYLLLAMLAVIFLLLPKGFPGRWLGLVLFTPALLFVNKMPPQGAFSYSQLDVGQGTASVIHTANHTLIYDTGTRLSNSFDIGKLVVNPYLKYKGVTKVDMMILSHHNLDHFGGAASIINENRVHEVFSSDINILKNTDVTTRVKPCVKGKSWNWDGVDFEIIWPDNKNLQLNDNNRSCILRVSNNYHSILLTGDIQRKAEKLLLENNVLASEVITIPHHGSKTSSTQKFLEAVSPSLAINSTGYRNRFGHPKPAVLDRYRSLSVPVLDTVNAGEIEVDFPADSKPLVIRKYRQLKQRFWNRDQKMQKKGGVVKEVI